MWEWEFLKRFIHSMKKWEGSEVGVYLDLVLIEMDRLEGKPENPEYSLDQEEFYAVYSSRTKATMFKELGDNACATIDKKKAETKFIL